MNPLLNRYFYKLTTLEVLATPWVEAESLVASSGIEPESGASETLILSIVRRGQKYLI